MIIFLKKCQGREEHLIKSIWLKNQDSIEKDSALVYLDHLHLYLTAAMLGFILLFYFLIFCLFSLVFCLFAKPFKMGNKNKNLSQRTVYSPQATGGIWPVGCSLLTPVAVSVLNYPHCSYGVGSVPRYCCPSE